MLEKAENDEEITVSVDFSAQLINLTKFCDSYFSQQEKERILKEFNIHNNEKPQYITLEQFRGLLEKLNTEKNYKISQKNIEKIKENLSKIKQDFHLRVIRMSMLKEISGQINFMENALVQQIRDINQQVEQKIKYINPNWQLLYIVQTNHKMQINGQDYCLIKLGKTIHEIEKYILNLKQTYFNRIAFRPLFAKRLYTPKNTLVDIKPFHNKLITQSPECKVFLRSDIPDKKDKYFVEFYYLNNTFIDKFIDCLFTFINEHQQSYDEYEQLQQKQINKIIKQLDQKNVAILENSIKNNNQKQQDNQNDVDLSDEKQSDELDDVTKSIDYNDNESDFADSSNLASLSLSFHSCELQEQFQTRNKKIEEYNLSSSSSLMKPEKVSDSSEDESESVKSDSDEESQQEKSESEDNKQEENQQEINEQKDNKQEENQQEEKKQEINQQVEQHDQQDQQIHQTKNIGLTEYVKETEPSVQQFSIPLLVAVLKQKDVNPFVKQRLINRLLGQQLK